MQNKHKILSLPLLIILAVMIFGSTPRSAQAQWIVSDPGQTAQNAAKWVWEKVEKVYSKIQGIIGAQVVEQTVSTYLNQFAYSVATELATGGPGGKPLFSTKSITKSLQSAQDAALGEFIGELSDKNFADLGINLCDPSLEAKLTITLSLIDTQAPAEPRCDWRDVQRQWQQFGDNFTADLVKLQLDTRSGNYNAFTAFFDNFSPAQSDFGAYIILSQEAARREQEAKEAQALTEEQCMGLYPKRTKVSDQIKTHCAAIWALNFGFVEIINKEPERISDSKQAATQTLGQIIKTAAKNFTQTFASKLLRNWIQEGTWSLFGRDDTNLRDDLLARLRGGSNLYQPSGSDIFEDFQKIEFTRVDDYNFLENFSLCPQVAEYRNPDNCVVNSSFVTAATSKQTLRQAINNGLINPNTPLINPSDALRNTSDNCYLDAFCYSNLVKLRKANIIPVGWEMAAERSSETAPVTIQQAIDCFEDSACPFGASSEWQVDGQDHNPFYHLVDPNWVLKSPSAQCNALVYSGVIEAPESSDRQQYCADAEVCLREDSNGNCLQGEYGYCTKSENIWRTDADVCTDGELYSGCLTFEHETLPTASYLQQTLDYCTADAAGCQRYAQETDSSGNFILQSIASDSDDLFLNSQSDTCRASDAGCTEFIALVPDLAVNTIPNASFDDTDNNNAPDGWSSIGVEYDGDRILNDFTDVSEKIILLPDTTYVLSALVAQDTNGGSGQARVVLNTCDVTGDCTNTSAAGGVDNVGGTCILGQNVSTNIDLQITPDDQDMQRGYCSFTTNQYVRSANIFVMSNTPGEALWFDDLKLEIVSSHGFTPSGYSDYGDGGQIYMTSARFMCTEDEVGCRGYAPDAGGAMVPAVIEQGDLCPQECVGYSTFTEQPTNFDIIEGDSDVEYYNFIAGTATQCPAQYVGCEEFTNLDEVAQGGEGLEYYTYLRQCVPPSVGGSTYYTWEGSDVSGYQIRTWLILESNLPGGAPCTNVDPGGTTCIDGNLGHDPAICNNIQDDPNCREFFDDAGNSHLRLQDRVIFVSSDCHDYRRSISNEIYKAIPQFSDSCPAEFNGCREYYGNAANNIRQLFNDGFENGTYQPWNGAGVDLSNESLNNNGHSLKVSANDTFGRELADQTINNNKTYQLSWWMKNNSLVNTIGISMVIANGTGQVTIGFPDSSAMHDIAGGNWHYYTTSLHLDLPEGVDLGLALRFDVAGIEDDLFLDNITLREVADNITVVKNSWETPASCDNPYEGYHLGCQAYTDTNGRQYNLKSFSRLCRENAIGCIAVINTHNSTNPYSETFNAGDYSEITVSQDTLAYLVPDTAKYCQPSYKGCQALGLEDRLNPGDFGTVYKINNPDQYGDSLCTAENVYCEEFASDKGPFYFRDPGIDTCTYQVNLPVVGDNGIEQNLTGWFRTASLNQEDSEPVGCSDDGDGFYDQPSELDLASDIAATCPEDKNLCTGFVDPQDSVGCLVADDPNVDGVCSVDPDDNLDEITCLADGGAWTPACQTYYYYDNDKIDDSSCNSQVDQNSGCVLFHETNNWNTEHTEVVDLYDSGATYAQNIAQNRPLSPVSCDPADPAACDANRLIKVQKDRQCSEWLACKSSVAVEDPPGSGKFRTVCDAVGACLEYDNENNITHCKRWADESTDPVPLLTSVYQSRATGQNSHLQWGDDEYIGYSVPNMLPIERMVVYDFGDETNSDPRLVFDGGNIPVCENNDGANCSSEIYGQVFNGICQDSLCYVSPLAGSSNNSGFGIATRGYAASDAPFPTTAYDPVNQTNNPYRGVNICENPDGSCELKYIKATYGQGIKVMYYMADEEGVPPPSICTSGNTSMENCTLNAQCNTDPTQADGVCSVLTKKETFSNWAGICLESDRTFRLLDEDDPDGGEQYFCNQWYPTDKITGVGSLYDNYQTAGYYNPSGNDLLFCAVGQPFASPTERYYCASVLSIGGLQYCAVLVKIPAGTQVNVDAAGNYGNALANYYLRDGTYKFYDQDGNGPDQTILNSYPDGFGVDLIMRQGAVPETESNHSCDPTSLAENNGIYSLFAASDFSDNLGNATIETIDINAISTLFDAPVGNQIEYYYYDQQIRANGSSYWSKGIQTPRYSYQTTPRGICDNGDNDDNCEMIYDCSSTTHEVRHWARYQDYGCGSSTNLHQRYKICNPLPYNYYIRAAYPDPVYLCEERDCSTAQNKGLSCLRNQSTYFDMLTASAASSGYSWLQNVQVNGNPRPISSIAAMASESLCYENPNCEFLYCLEHGNIYTSVSTRNAVGDSNGGDIYSQVSSPLNVTYCTEYGETILTYNDAGDIITNATFTDCYNRIYRYNSNAQVVETIVGVDPNTNNNLLVENDLLDEAFDLVYFDNNSSDCLQSDQASGCIEIANAMPEYGTLNTYYNVQIDDLNDVDCTGLDCYQQCSTVSLVSSGDDTSGVRTDIWWREGINAVNNDPNDDRITPAWSSWYYDNANNYGQHDDVTFDRVGTLVDNLTSPYGSAEGSPVFGPALTRVPITGSALSALTSVNFYSITDFADAAEQMTYLFGLVYNLNWQNGAYEAAGPAAGYQYIAGQANGTVNPRAGQDYPPRSLQVCGQGMCESGSGYYTGFSINNATSTDLLGDDGSLFVALKFYYHAHPDHMPITNLSVDWDGADTDPASDNFGKYKNNLPNCDPETNMPGLTGSLQGFGGTPGACSESYRVFYNTYQMDVLNHACPGDPTASCYRPSVTITDNWGQETTYTYDGVIRISND